jgi:hypothetical protein
MHDLPIFGTLETMAELGIALLGFSGVVSVFGRKKALPWTIQDKVWFGGLLNWSFILIVGGFTPSIMREIFADIEMVWFTSNLIFFSAHLVSYLWFGYTFYIKLGSHAFRKVERAIVHPSFVVAASILLAQAYQIFFPSTHIDVVYVIAVAWFIYVSCCAFVFMLFPRTDDEVA